MRAKPATVLVLSGPLCSGKTALAEQLAAHGWTVLSARARLRALAQAALDSRKDLQAFGSETEAATRGQWLGDEAQDALATSERVVVDSARTAAQVNAVRSIDADHALALHVTASPDVRAQRFAVREADSIDEGLSFDAAVEHDIEQNADSVQQAADHVIDTSQLTEAQVLAQVLELLER